MKNQPLMIECDCSPIVPNSHAKDCPTYRAIVASIEELAERDHGFLPEEEVRSICEPFGFMVYTYLAKANPQDFKGLSLFDKDGSPLDEMRGQATHIVAKQICKHLEIDYPPMHGIGSQLEVCINALRKFWGIENRHEA